MKKFLVLPLFLLCSCATRTPYFNVIDSSSVKSINYNNLRTAKSCTFLDIFGDRSISSISKDNNITKVVSVDESQYLLIMRCTVVHGE
jgi:uncharacterized lipoprotein YajG